MDQWNIVGELEACKYALKIAKEKKYKKIAIYHDLVNISLWSSGEWKAKNKYTQEFVAFTEKITKELEIAFVKVKAHSGEDEFNDLADKAAKNSINQFLNKEIELKKKR